MKLQMAIDTVDSKKALELVEKVHDVVDIVEVGTPMVILEGQVAVRALRAKYPDLIILSDTKIMDGGSLEAEYACQAGADIVTVLAAAPDPTIKGAMETAHRYGRKIMVDMINVPDVISRAKELDTFGVDYICVHTAVDVQSMGKTPLEELEETVAVVKNAKVAVAGGINLKTVGAVKNIGPEIVIVGGGLTGSANPRETALALQKVIKA